MSLRIRKQMGYGITNLQVDEDGVITDPRINVDSLNRVSRMNVAGYKKFLHEKYPVAENQSPYDYSLNDLVHVRNNLFSGKDTEATNLSHLILILESESIDINQGATLLISPYLCAEDWMRSDDYIDYAENEQDAIDRQEEFSPVSRVRILQNASFPYESNFVNSKTLELIDNQEWNLIKSFHKAGIAQEFIRNYLEKMDFSSMEEAFKMIIPEVPTGVKDIAEWTDVFTNKNESQLLKFMVVTHWS
jgi:hypothetical protein